MSRRYAEGTVDHWRGRWRLRVTVTEPGGKRRRRAFYFADEATAIRERDRIRHESHYGDPVLPGPETVATLFTRWLELRAAEVENGQLARSTYRDYRNTVERHILPALGRKRLRENLAPSISLFLAEKAQEGRPASFQRRLLVVLRQGFGLGVVWGLVPRNYADRHHVKAPRAPRPRPDAWTEPETHRFLAATATSPYRVIWRFLLATGVREGEALGLQWEHVDLDTGVVQIVRQRMRSHPGEPLFGALKTERSRREIVIDGDTIALLREHKRQQQARRDAVKGTPGETWHEGDLVFSTTHGKPYDLTNVGAYWRRDVQRSGVRKLKLHGTRHTHATLLIERGVPIEVVSRRLGHASTAFTADVYFKPQETTARLAADRIAEALGGGKNGIQQWDTASAENDAAARLLSSLDSN